MRPTTSHSPLRRGVTSFFRRQAAMALLVSSLAPLAPAALSSLSTTGRRRRGRWDDAPPGELSDAIRVRLDSPTLDRLDRVVAFAQNKGQRKVTRSFLIRDALDAYLAEVEKDFPEITRKADTSV